jgi:hypothetical protein
MRNRLCACVVVGGAALFCTTAGCGEAPVLTVKEVKHLLRQLPYRYEFRPLPTPEGAEAAVAGRAFGPHHTVLNFGIALGHGDKPAVSHRKAAESYRYLPGGFIFTSDLFVWGPDGRLKAGPQFRTAAQSREAGHMEVLMTDVLCRATTGEHCPAV